MNVHLDLMDRVGWNSLLLHMRCPGGRLANCSASRHSLASSLVSSLQPPASMCCRAAVPAYSGGWLLPGRPPATEQQQRASGAALQQLATGDTAARWRTHPSV
jgi:hypothetical protein